MFSASMQSQQALANQRRDLQEAAAGYERRLLEAEQLREREVAALHARATQAMRELQARAAQELQRVSQELQAEREQVRAERARAAELQATIDQFRAERLQRREEGLDEEASRELDAARADARRWRLEVDVLTTRLEAREKLFHADRQQKEAEEQERDAKLTKAQTAWKERLADVEAQLEKAWAEQTKLQEELAAAQGGQMCGGGGRPAPAAAPAAFPDISAFGGATAPPTAEAGPASATNPWADAVASTGPLDADAAFGAAAAGGWPGDSGGDGGGGGGFGAGNLDGWPGMAGSSGGSKSAAKEGKRRSKSGGRKKDTERGSAGGSGPLQPASTANVDYEFSFGGCGDGGAPGGGGNDYEQVQQLVGMGFPEEKVQEVLSQVNGNMDQAIARLLGGT